MTRAHRLHVRRVAVRVSGILVLAAAIAVLLRWPS